MKNCKSTYHIIGAGIAGLACAKYIKKYDKNAITVVYEATDKLGGRAYSYDDKDLNCRLDNATHVLVGANKNISKAIGEQSWVKECGFWDAQSGKIEHNLKRFKPQILKAICNTADTEIAPEIYKKIWWSLFPFSRAKTKIWFSKNDLSQILINPLMAYVDDLRLNSKLVRIGTQFGQVAQLEFNNQSVEIGAYDKVICALDARNQKALLGGEDFEFNSIINIFYHTSETINLSNLAKLMGVVNGLADWFFVSNNVLGVTISDSKYAAAELDDLARQVWLEICKLRGVNSAFVPPFRITCHKQATIKQDSINNAKRPENALTDYKNLFIAGDWTMKDYPCCMEGAYLSGKRAARAATRNSQ